MFYASFQSFQGFMDNDKAGITLLNIKNQWFSLHLFSPVSGHVRSHVPLVRLSLITKKYFLKVKTQLSYMPNKRFVNNMIMLMPCITIYLNENAIV